MTEAVEARGAYWAVQLRVAEYVEELRLLPKENDTMIVPINVGNVSSIITTAMSVIRQTRGSQDAQVRQPRAACRRTGLRDAPGAFADSGLPTSPRRLAPARRAGRW